MTAQLALPDPLPAPVIDAVRQRAGRLGVPVYRYIKIAWLCRVKWHQLVYRSQFKQARDFMSKRAKGLRGWAERMGHSPGDHRVWVEIAMREWCSQEDRT